ncbi:MAG: hypothetical protein EPO40_12900 [Myxococcaceae bacterium]|nr:MAG: hypothetical protein EPO40_12900 [Myxococcaceae bacterium]
MMHRLLFALAVAMSLPVVASAQRVVVRTGHRSRVTTVVAPAGGTTVVVNPPGPGNTTVVRTGRRGNTVVNQPAAPAAAPTVSVRTGRRGNTVVNTPGPGRVVIHH